MGEGGARRLEGLGEGGRAALYSVVIQAAGPLFYPNVSLCYSLESFQLPTTTKRVSRPREQRLQQSARKNKERRYKEDPGTLRASIGKDPRWVPWVWGGPFGQSPSWPALPLAGAHIARRWL